MKIELGDCPNTSVNVMLNGEHVIGVVEADDEAGYVLAYVLDNDCMIWDDQGLPVMERKEGNVHFDLITEPLTPRSEDDTAKLIAQLRMVEKVGRRNLPPDQIRIS